MLGKVGSSLRSSAQCLCKETPTLDPLRCLEGQTLIVLIREPLQQPAIDDGRHTLDRMVHVLTKLLNTIWQMSVGMYI